MAPFAPLHPDIRCTRLLSVVACLALALFAGCSIPGAGARGTTTGGKTVVSTATSTPPPACPSNGYCAKVPGPNCDAGGAQWFTVTPATVTCETSGMQLSVPSNQGGGVAFAPPGKTFPTSYSFAVTAQVNPSVDGCVELFTAAQGGLYTYFACSAGIWFINLNLQGTPKELAKGVFTTSPVYRLVVTTSGNDRSLMINGTLAGSVTDGTVPATVAVGVSFLNRGSATQSITVSAFTYTPLG